MLKTAAQEGIPGSGLPRGKGGRGCNFTARAAPVPRGQFAGEAGHLGAPGSPCSQQRGVGAWARRIWVRQQWHLPQGEGTGMGAGRQNSR